MQGIFLKKSNRSVDFKSTRIGKAENYNEDQNLIVMEKLHIHSDRSFWPSL
jgi:hypothetical protein